MRTLLTLLLAWIPISLHAATVYQIDDKDHFVELVFEGRYLQMKIAPEQAEPAVNEIIIRREDAAVALWLVDHKERVIKSGRFSPDSRSTLRLTGETAFDADGLKLHVAGGASDIWIATQKTGEVGELLEWISLLEEVSSEAETNLPGPFEDGFPSGELTLIWSDDRPGPFNESLYEPIKGGFDRWRQLAEENGEGFLYRYEHVVPHIGFSEDSDADSAEGRINTERTSTASEGVTGQAIGNIVPASSD